MTEESVRRTVRAGEERERVKAAGRILTGPRTEGVIVINLTIATVMVADKFGGPAQHNVPLSFGLIALGSGILVGAVLLRRPYPRETIERALDDLGRGSDRADLRALMTFTRRQRWTPEQTARLTAHHLPMARRAIERGRGPLPTGLARWIGALRSTGVVSEDLSAIARRVDASPGS